MRSPTDSEMLAYRAVMAELKRQEGDPDGWSPYISGNNDFYHTEPGALPTVKIDGEIDFMPIVRAVIRSLTPATIDMILKGREHIYSISKATQLVVDLASPEIKS